MHWIVRIILRHHLNAFAKGIVSAAKERMYITNEQAHELSAIIDRRLWPERHGRDKSPW